MQLPSRYWADLSTRHFAQLAASAHLPEVVALLPVGATEQHGPHLPLDVDRALVDGVVTAALAHVPADLPVLVLPTQPIGLSVEHDRFPGTLTLSATTLIALWSEIGACVARSGVRKLLIFNAHGGQVSVMDIVARQLRSAHDLLVYSSSWYTLPLADAVMGQFSAREQRFGVHGGDMETSMMLALRPSTVDMTQAENFHSSAEDRAAQYPILGNGSSARLGWQMQDYNPRGACGNAADASAAKGRALVDAAAVALARLLEEISRLPLTTLRNQPELAP
jgi:creatinine amidohydrolase